MSTFVVLSEIHPEVCRCYNPFVAKCVKCKKYGLANFANFAHVCIAGGKCYHFRLKIVPISARNTIV